MSDTSDRLEVKISTNVRATEAACFLNVCLVHLGMGKAAEEELGICPELLNLRTSD